VYGVVAVVTRQGVVSTQAAYQIVAAHVRNVLKKLGLNSRNQIAAWFREQR
jgi:DNA-binding NarL/FixJ family response regulator